MRSPDTAANVIPDPSIQMTLGLRFVRTTSSSLLASEGPGTPPGGGAPEDVVPMSAQYQWLAVRANANTLQFDPGQKDPQGNYAVAPFLAALNLLLATLIDPGISYSAEIFMPGHQIKDGRWLDGGGHIFKLLANAVPLVQEASIADLDFQVEVLISVEVIN
jgi:hypothetical protein